MAASMFVDYYRILEVEPSASAHEIRRSFRKLVLRAHPDKNPHRTPWSERRVRELIEAYDVIGDREKRRRFDEEYRARAREERRRERPRRQGTPESQLFFFRKSDPGALALRILYLLLHRRGREAVPILGAMEAEYGPDFLVTRLDRDDYLDCLFLLGEHHLERRAYAEAFRRMRAFYRHEREVRYPRHYLDSVVEYLKDLYLRKLPQVLPPAQALRLLEEASELRLGSRERVALGKLKEELRDRAARDVVRARARNGTD